MKKENKKMKDTKEAITINKRGIIAAILNFILVGLGYVYLKKYKKAIIMFVIYFFITLIISYIATFFFPLIFIVLLVNLYFAWDAYKMAICKDSQ